MVDYGPDLRIDHSIPRCRKMLERTNFPVGMLKLPLARDPRSVLLSTIIPTLIQAALAIKCANIDDQADRNNNLAVPLLAIGGIQALLKSHLPTLGGTTTAEKFVLFYSSVMLIPLGIPGKGYDRDLMKFRVG